MSLTDKMELIKYNVKKLLPSAFYSIIVQRQYYRSFGKFCNLIEPQTFNEKLQWSKLYRNNKKLSYYADKITVREYVKNCIGEEFLIPTIGEIYGGVNEIDMDTLPNRFVIKTNHGCGFNVVVNDKSHIDFSVLKKTLNRWLEINYAYYFMELQYKYIKPKIYIEKNLLEPGMSDLPDYKFFCFNGRVFCSYTMQNYVLDHSCGRVCYCDRNYNIMPYGRMEFEAIKEQPQKPLNYWKMVEIAEKLSEGFSHVRVDLYNLNGRIYFGEMTFTSTGGYAKYDPPEFDVILGKQWDISSGI